MSTATFTEPQDALDALDLRPTDTVFVGGVSVDAVSWSAKFGTDDALSTCKFTIPLPRPETVVANAVVQIMGGHNDLTGTLFHGRIPQWRGALTERGAWLDVTAVGWTSLLAYPEQFDLIFDGPIKGEDLFDALCARRGVPSYVADPMTDPSGTISIAFGGNPQLDDGKVKIPASSNPLATMNNAFEQCGYRIFDRIDGVVRLKRVSGKPAGDPVVTFTEGLNLFGVTGAYDIRGIVNYWDIHGPTYEDQYGASIPIRAFPAAVPSDPLIPVNGGVSYANYRNSFLVTQQLAEIVRQVKEIDTSEPSRPVTWEAIAVPGVNPGDHVVVDAATVEASGAYWVTDIDIGRGEGPEIETSYVGWAGAGEVLPAGNDRTVTTIQTAPLHLGNEYEAHYAHPAVEGTSKTWAITIPERATAVNVRGLHHGTNSQLIGGVNTDLEVTKWQVWAADVPAAKYDTTGTDAPRPEASGNMPIVNEDLALRKNYTLIANWSPFAINLGRLDPGDYVLRLVCGVKASYDDFEVRDVVLEVYGIQEPALIPQEVT